MKIGAPKKGCSRCGEEGHQASQCLGNCPNFGALHSPADCPAQLVTCFLCEGQDHVPANCPLYLLIGKARQLPCVNIGKKSREGRSKKGTCFACDEPGHFSRECPQRGLDNTPTKAKAKASTAPIKIPRQTQRGSEARKRGCYTCG